MPAVFESVATNANNSSLADVVENDGDVMFELELDRLVETLTSVAMAPQLDVVTKKRTNIP
jgi:hypothetical protein